MDNNVQERKSTLDTVVVQAEKDSDCTGKKWHWYAFWVIPNHIASGAVISVCSFPLHQILLVPDFIYNYLFVKLPFLLSLCSLQMRNWA